MLRDSFLSNGADSSMDRMRRLMETAKKNSPTAARTINYAFAYGCGFNFQDVDKAYGAYDKSNNMVYLNPKYSDEELLSTLVHECRHALQPKEFETWANNIRTNLQWVRAAEADAMAHECAAAYEMKNDLPQVWNIFKQKHTGIATAYEAAADKPDKALGEAFKAWHDDLKYVSKYDKNTLDQLSFYVGRAGTNFLKGSIPAEEIGEKMCRKDGKSYLEKGFMESAGALTVDEREILPKIVNVKYAAFEMTDFKDSSDEELYTRGINGIPVSRRPALPDAGDRPRRENASAEKRPLPHTAEKQMPPAVKRAELKDRIAAIKGRLGGR